MKQKIAFIADFYANEILGGGENNDANLITHLDNNHQVFCYKSDQVQITDLEDKDKVIVGNFVLLHPDIRRYLMATKEYIIYEHDHKYVSTRDPSKFPKFIIPAGHIVNAEFYQSAAAVVVLSKICKEVLQNTISGVNAISIGCSLWSPAKFNLLDTLAATEKSKDLCIMYSTNATKNYPFTVQYCEKNNLQYEAIQTQGHNEFLMEMANYKRFLFIPTVLETFSRVCAEAKMMNLDVMTNKNKIGFFSEDISSLKGKALIEALKERNKTALHTFQDLIC